MVMGWLKKTIGATPVAKSALHDLARMVRGGASPNAKTYHEYIYVWICLQKICGAVAAIPNYIETPDGRELTPEERDFERLLRKPSPRWTYETMMWYAALSLAVRQQAFFQIVRGSRNRVVELRPLNPLLMTVQYYPNSDIIQYFQYTGAAGSQTFPVDEETGESDIVYIYRPGLDMTKVEHSPLSVSGEVSAFFAKILERGRDLATNQPNMAGILHTPADLEEPAIKGIAQGLADMAAGRASSGKAMLVSGSEWKYTRLTEDPSTLLKPELKDALARDICAIFGVPPQLVGIPGSQTFANYQQAVISFHTETVLPLYVRPILRGLGDACLPNSSLVPDADAIPAIVQARLELVNIATQANFLSIDEKRELLGYPKLEDEEDGKLIPEVERLNNERLKIEASSGLPDIEDET